MFSTEQAKRIHEGWGWFLASGIMLLILGFSALVMSGITTVLSVLTLGMVMLIAGFAQVVHAIATRSNKGAVSYGLIGALNAVAGYFLFTHPLRGAFTLTLLIASLFVASGLLKLMVSAKFAGFKVANYMLLNGIVSVVLGALIFMQWPASGLWVIGTFVGISLMMDGFSWMSMAFAAKGIKQTRDAKPPKVEAV